MQVILKRAWEIGLIVTMGIFLGACSAVPVTSTSSPLDSPPAASPAETLSPSTPNPTMTIAAQPTETVETVGEEEIETPTGTPTEEVDTEQTLADVLSVVTSGTEDAYRFAVEIRSPDTGCEQYADWWEVVTEDGALIYRRILAHSHVNEQPFTRAGGPVAISTDTVVIVRAHMHPDGYGGTAFRGSVATGFEAVQLETGFAADLEQVEPLPSGCGF